MVAGLPKGLSHADAAPLGDGIRPQILLGSLISGVGVYLSVRFLTSYFEAQSLRVPALVLASLIRPPTRTTPRTAS